MNEKQGHLHPITQLFNEALSIFVDLGFEIVLGPEIETEFYNFDAMNIPADHPARDMQDTFWIKSGKEQKKEKRLPRTHVSGIQVRYMEKHQPPFKIVYPGKVFRHEATDATHEAQFYQLEALVITEDASIAALKGVIETFFKNLFGATTKIRVRPSFFPFTEPSLEVDVTCFKCNGAGCSVCKNSGWIEIMGAGMVHPNVLKAGGIDSTKWKGFAFAFGFDRLVMLKYGIEDIRLLYSGDLRFVNQF